MAHKKNNKEIHIPFGKQFYKLLTVSVLSLFAVYGGIIWANSIGVCAILDSLNFPTGSKVCVKLGAAGTPFATEDFEVSDANNDSQIGGGGYGSNVIGKELRFTNNNPGTSVFVPLRQKRELDSFLAAKNTGNNTFLNNIEICEVGLPQGKNRLERECF